MNVYLVSSGSYSDYSVSCAFTTVDLAIEYAAAQNKVPVEVQRRLHEISDWKYPEWIKARQQIDKENPQMDDGYFVEVRDLYDTLPVVK